MEIQCFYILFHESTVFLLDDLSGIRLSAIFQQNTVILDLRSFKSGPGG